MILVIDNYDSFTFNLVDELRSHGAIVDVRRNDALTVEGIRRLRPSHIVISPGPGHPRDAGICCDLIRELAPTTPILGVCLGHQAIAIAFGARINRATTPRHGEASRIYHDSGPLFRGVRSPFQGGRYHSLIVEEAGLPEELSITAFTSDGVIMALSHREFEVHGVQFHPESILTPDGKKILRNFVQRDRLGANAIEPAMAVSSKRHDARVFVGDVLGRIRRGAALSEGDAAAMMQMILSEKLGLEELIAYLELAAARGPSVDEIVGSARVLREAMTPLQITSDALDNCGTGGDCAKTFNISTIAALVAAAAGQPIVKHGNRSSSGGVGSADLLEAFGLPLDLGGPALLDSLHRHRFAFLFAPRFRPAAPRIREARRRTSSPTLFNLLGPLCSPALPAFQVIGTFHESIARTLAEAVLRLGTRRTFIVVGPGGIDELIPQHGNVAFEVANGTIRRHDFDAHHAGLEPCSVEDLRGGDVGFNAQLALRILAGERGAPRDAVVMNAGLALLTSGRAESLYEGCRQCAAAIDCGMAGDLLRALKTNARPPEKNP
ncbi:MAG: anthranilate phosphoribosyltransferase [Planctomycetes bacterium]|nr:anthranilate phosphoribosyltransferase [Planctomycetota bacterium]MBI3832930.1 anthranilate phosphoribosyltransferase [Planctomycetota bacterium]